MSQNSIPESQQRILSTITQSGLLKLSLDTIPVPKPNDNEVLIRIEAAPINPSDLVLLTGPGMIDSVRMEGTSDNPEAVMDVPENILKAFSQRLDIPMAAGNEGAGVVVEAGENFKHLIGKTVGVAGGDMYCEYRCVYGATCLIMNDGTSAKQAASSFVNPLTSLSMVETMRLEGHKGLVHTAAASNLGQMLVKICKADNVPLVNIVRSEKQVEILKELGAEYVCNSSDPDFKKQLVSALLATGATLAFDAIGGGKLASQILSSMELAANADVTEYSRYGSSVNKQVYIYGGLDLNPTTLHRSYGMCWGIGGWLLTPFLSKLGSDRLKVLRKRIADEIDTTFASHYSKEISLKDVLNVDAIKGYTKVSTGDKYLIVP